MLGLVESRVVNVYKVLDVDDDLNVTVLIADKESSDHMAVVLSSCRNIANKGLILY